MNQSFSAFGGFVKGNSQVVKIRATGPDRTSAPDHQKIAKIPPRSPNRLPKKSPKSKSRKISSCSSVR
jgi:hypothetical protein